MIDSVTVVDAHPWIFNLGGAESQRLPAGPHLAKRIRIHCWRTRACFPRPRRMERMDAHPLLARIARMLEEHGLEEVIMRPYYPASGLFRIVRDDDGLQIDFMAMARNCSSPISLISSKVNEPTGRPKDTAALNILEKTLHKKTRDQKRKTGSSEERE